MANVQEYINSSITKKILNNCEPTRNGPQIYKGLQIQNTYLKLQPERPKHTLAFCFAFNP